MLFRPKEKELSKHLKEEQLSVIADALTDWDNLENEIIKKVKRSLIMSKSDHNSSDGNSPAKVPVDEAQIDSGAPPSTIIAGKQGTEIELKTLKFEELQNLINGEIGKDILSTYNDELREKLCIQLRPEMKGKIMQCAMVVCWFE